MRYIAEDATLRFKFSTRRFSTGAPHTLAGTPSLSVYPEGNLTQITTGITLTVDYDGKTGLNDVVIDLSASASYAAGSAYTVVVEAGTVDSVSVVGEVVYEFYIHASGGLEALITRGLLALPNAAPDAAGGLPISDAGGLDLDTLLSRLDAAISTRLASAGYTAPLDAAGTRSALGMASADLDTQLGAIAAYIDTEVAAIKAVTDNLPDSGALTSLAQAAKLLAYVRLLARKDSAIATDAATELGEINANTGTGAGSYDNTTDSAEALRDRGDAAWTTVASGTIESAVDAAFDNVPGTPTAGSRDDMLSDLAAGLPAGGMFDPATDRVLLDKTDALRIESAVNDASATTTSFVTDLTEATNDHYKDRTIIFTSGNLLGQATDITAYNGTTKAVTVTALTEAPANNDTFEIV